MASSRVHLFIGSNNRTADTLVPGDGITVMTFDEDTLELEHVCTTDEIDNPSFLAVDPTGTCLYAVSEVGSWPECTVSAYRFDAAAGTLTFLNKQPTRGRATCHVSIIDEGHVAVANYSEGTGGPDQAVTIYRTELDGSLSAPIASAAHTSPVGPRADRQERNHAHSIQQTPDGKFLLAADLGTDEIIAYRLDGDRLEPAFTYKATPGAGPRHLAFHPDGRIVYAVNEIASTVSVLDLSDTGLTRRQELSSLPADFTEQAWAADIHLSPDGRYLYASNRVHDSIAAFSVAEDGALAFIGTTPSGGEWPRSFAITPSGRHLLAANHRSNDISIFARDVATGGLTFTGQPIEIVTPMRVQALALPGAGE